MAYTNVNFKTKKELKAALLNGDIIEVWSPGPFPVPKNGKVSLEGPHYPEPHKWYAQGKVENGRLISIT